MNYYSDVTTYRFYNKRHQLVQRASIIVICFTLFRNVRPCTILGYTLTNIPQKFNTDKTNKKNLHRVASCNRRRTLQATEHVQEAKLLLLGLHVRHAYMYLKNGSSKVSLMVRNISNSHIFLKKGVQVARVMSASLVPLSELSPEMEATLGAES